MIGRIMIFVFLLLVSAGIWVLNLQYNVTYLEKLYLTTFSLAAIYFIFKIVFEELVAKNIKDLKPRYSFRKAVSIIYMAVFLITIVAIWVESPEALLVTYGLIAAGIAVALQDLFKSLAGGIILFVTRIYKVGDRVQINSKEGDVIDIDLLYTTILEMKEWVDGDQATGRLTMVPNSVVLSGVINNYTKDNNFMWDEIRVPVTYESNWRKAMKIMQDIATKETKDVAKKAEKDISKIREKYYFTGRPVDPQVFVGLTDNWINLTVRYVTLVRGRRGLKSNLSLMILEEIEKSKDVKIASATLTVTNVTGQKKKK